MTCDGVEPLFSLSPCLSHLQTRCYITSPEFSHNLRSRLQTIVFTNSSTVIPPRPISKATLPGPPRKRGEKSPTKLVSRMSHILTRPSTLGFLAIGGTGAFYLTLRSRSVKAKQARKSGSPPPSSSPGSRSGVDGEGENFAVRTGRSGGGV